MCVSPQSEEFERSMEKMVELGLAIGRGESSPRVYLQYAETLWNVRDQQATIRALDAAIDGQPALSTLDLSKAYASRSICFLQLGDMERAMDDATTSIDLMPRAHPYGLRAVTLLQLKRFDDALADIEEASRLDGNDWEVRAWRGTVYLALSRYAEAIAEFNWVLSTGECHRYASEIYRDRARAQLALGNPAAAIEDCDLAIDEDHHEQSHWPFIVRSRAREAHQVYLVRGSARLALGELPRALGDCCFAATIAPADPAVYQLRARIYEAIGNLPEAVNDLIRANHLEAAFVPEPELVNA